MIRLQLTLAALIFTAWSSTLSWSEAQTEGSASDDKEEAEKAIRANVEAYKEAYQDRDAEGLASLWSENGRFTSPLDGEVIEGREGIAAEFEKLFAGSGDQAAELEVEVLSLRWLAPNVVVEDGLAWVVLGDHVSASEYTAIHTREANGEWKIDSVRETELEATSEVAPDAPEALAELEWLLGSWRCDAGDFQLTTQSEWAMGGRYLKRAFSLQDAGETIMDGIEVVGWDPSESRLRAWVFDSEGGFASGDWSHDTEAGHWIRRVRSTLANGDQAFATYLLTPVEDGRYRWRAVGRELNGLPQPNIEEQTFTRVDRHD